MSGRKPQAIWEDALEEGHDRLERGPGGLVSTGLLGGVDVMLGVIALAITTAALESALPRELSHVLASLAFGLGFAFIVVGRSELFTENFLIPVVAAVAGRERAATLPRLWILTFVGNVIALLVLAAALSVEGVLDPETLKAAGDLADTLGERALLPSFISAVVAGVVMTLFTWLALAAERDSTRVLLALLIGFLLAAPSLNHAVVGVGEMAFGLFAGTADIGWGDAGQTLVTAIVGNLVGGLGFVTVTRLFQVSGQEGPLGG